MVRFQNCLDVGLHLGHMIRDSYRPRAETVHWRFCYRFYLSLCRWSIFMLLISSAITKTVCGRNLCRKESRNILDKFLYGKFPSYDMYFRYWFCPLVDNVSGFLTGSVCNLHLCPLTNNPKLCLGEFGSFLLLEHKLSARISGSFFAGSF